MDRESAAGYAVELLEAASEGKWAELLAVGLDAETTELVRVLASMDKEITRLEAREKELNDALITRLMPLQFDDGSEPEPATSDQQKPAPESATPSTDPLADLQIGRAAS